MHHPEGKTDREQKYLIADRKYIDIIRFFHGRSGWTWIPVSPNCSRILPNTALGFPALTNTVFFWTNYRNVPWNRLESHHCVNHLRDSICFSQKDCFLEALQQHDKNVKETIYIDEFLPRSFVLCAAQDFQSSMEIFMCHFMYFAALAAIKHLSTGKFEDSKWTLFPSEEQISASIHLLTIIRCHMRSNMRQFIARELQNAFDLYDPCWKCLQHPLCSTWRPSINVMKYNEMNYLMKFFEANDNQYHLVQTSNVWICKPARSSQGRGIKLFTSLDTLNEHLRHELRSSPSKQSRNWIVQKYIESPVELRNSCSRVAGSLPHPSINRRKFDLRQWVLITSLRPLKVYWYRHCYARFSSKEYTLRNIDDRFVHLCNYSVQKANVTSSMARNPQESACIRHSKEIQQRLRFVCLIRLILPAF